MQENLATLFMFMGTCCSQCNAFAWALHKKHGSKQVDNACTQFMKQCKLQAAPMDLLSFPHTAERGACCEMK